jgi:Oxidoreductase family, NAD-binding Rossmann fold
VTPNHMHFAPAQAFLARGIHVICDKPLTHRLEDALTLASAVAGSGRIFALTHNYTGYPLVRQARDMVAGGALGTIRVVQVEYPQDWLTPALEETEAGRLADRSGQQRRCRLHRRHRHPCLQLGGVRHRVALRERCRRADSLRHGTGAGRQRPNVVALL